MTSIQTIPVGSAPMTRIAATPINPPSMGRCKRVLKTSGGGLKPAFVEEKNVASIIRKEVTELVRRGRKETEERVLELINNALSRLTGVSQGRKNQQAENAAVQPRKGQRRPEDSWIKVVKRKRRGPKPSKGSTRPRNSMAVQKPAKAQQQQQQRQSLLSGATPGHSQSGQSRGNQSQGGQPKRKKRKPKRTAAVAIR